MSADNDSTDEGDAVVRRTSSRRSARRTRAKASEQRWFFIGNDNRQHAYAADVAQRIEACWVDESRHREQIDVNSSTYVVVFTKDDVRQFARNTDDLLGVIVERERNDDVRASRYPTKFPPQDAQKAGMRGDAGSVLTRYLLALAQKRGGMPSPVLRAMREQRAMRASNT